MLHLYLHGRGRGHATRGLAIARTLVARGHAVRVFAGGDALSLLDDLPVSIVEPVRDGHRVKEVVRARTFEAACAVRADHARVVVSDGDLPALLGARSAGVPAIAVGHGLVFSHCHRPPYAPAGPWYREGLRAVANNPGARRAIAVSFAPLRPRSDAVVARPALAVPDRRAGDRCVCYFRDGAPDLLRRLVRLGARPLLFAATDPAIEGVEHRMLDRRAFLAAIASARVVIASAGSQLLSECAASSVPVFAVHAPDDDEQRLNVAMARAAGIATGGSIDAIEDAHLSAFLEVPPEPSAPSQHGLRVDEAVALAVDDLRTDRDPL